MPPEEPEITTYDYEYRTNTEVITAVEVSGGQSDPDHPVSVTFSVGGRSYEVGEVYYPSGDSQLAWIRWTTPEEPQAMTMTVRVRGGGGTSKGTLHINVVDLDENPPPDPNADDRNDGFTRPVIPSNAEVTSASWSVWRHGGRNIGYGTAEMRMMTGTGVTMAGGSLTWIDTPQA